MVITHSGPTGLSVVVLVEGELRVALVHAPILGQHTEDEGVADWDEQENHKDVTHMSAQVKTFMIRVKK